MTPKFKKNEIITCIIPNDSLILNKKYEVLCDSYVEYDVEYVTVTSPSEEDFLKGFSETRTCLAYRFVNLKKERKQKLQKIYEKIK